VRPGSTSPDYALRPARVSAPALGLAHGGTYWLRRPHACYDPVMSERSELITILHFCCGLLRQQHAQCATQMLIPPAANAC